MSSDPRTQTVQAPDGRQLEVVTAGPEDGRCYLFHSGTPSAAGAYPPLVAELAKRDMRLVTFSRPGYAGSSAMAGRAVGDVATDVQAILDALKIGPFFCAGQSGGGPHALACAALLPDRVIATATLAGVAPWPADGLDWFAGMGQENLDEFGASMKGHDALEAYLNPEAASLRAVQPADVAAALGDLVSDVDKAALTGGYAEYMAAGLRRAVSTGIAGMARRRHRVRHPVGLRSAVHPDPGRGLAGRRGSDGADGARGVARSAHPGSRVAPAPRRGPPLISAQQDW